MCVCCFLTENPKNKNKHFLSKRRKPEEDEKKLNMKRLRTDNISDYSESSDSEISNKRLTDSSSEQNSENELKSKNTSKINGEEGKSQTVERVEQTLTDRRSPWDEVQEDKKREEPERVKSSLLDQQEKPSLHAAEQPTPYEQNSKDPHVQECNAEKHHAAELKNEQFVPKPPTPKSVVDKTSKNSSEKESQDNAASTFGLQTVQKIESHSSDLKQQFANANFLEARKQEADQSWVSCVVNKMDLMQPGVVKANEHLNPEKEKVPYGSFMSSLNVASVAEDSKLRKQSPVPDSVKSKPSASVDHPKTKSPDVKPKFTPSSDTVKSKVSSQNSHAPGLTRSANKTDHDLPRSSFHPVPARVSALEATKSPLIIDKNEHFTVYRDPTLIGQETGTNHISPFLHQHNYPLHSSSHRTCLNPNAHHPALTGSSHLLPGSSTQTPLSAINTHPLSTAPHHSVHHPHLLPAVLPGVPAASLLGGHPRLETAHASSLSHLALAHQQQQQMLQHQSPHLLGQAHPSASYNQLGLYPIIWQYPNGTHAYSGLGLPSSKWVHPETPVNTEASLRRVSRADFLSTCLAEAGVFQYWFPRCGHDSLSHTKCVTVCDVPVYM